MRAYASIDDLAPVAAGFLKTYCSPSGAYAWPAYDTDTNPSKLTPVDLLAPGFLSYPIRGLYLDRMFQRNDEGGPANDYARLFDAMVAVVADIDAAELDFDSIDKHELSDRQCPGWGSVLRAIDAAQPCKGFTSVAVTKILHRKRPRLVPINDSRLRTFYGISGQRYSELFRCIHHDVTTHGDLLDSWRKPYWLDNEGPMSRLRVLDIVIWMHFEHASGASIDFVEN
jgi:hypothetical protein